jgi:hypothetical protein
MIIFMATTEATTTSFAGLTREYVEWCRDRYKDVAWFISKSHHSFERELEAWP